MIIILLLVMIIGAFKYSNECGIKSRNFCLRVGGESRILVADQAEIPASMGPFLQNEHTLSPVHKKQVWKCMHQAACLLL